MSEHRSARRLVIVWRKNTSAAVVEPVGRNAYWSENINAGGWVSSAGYMNVRTTILSMVRVKTGATEMVACVIRFFRRLSSDVRHVSISMCHATEKVILLLKREFWCVLFEQFTR